MSPTAPSDPPGDTGVPPRQDTNKRPTGKRARIGVDLGGTKIEAAAISASGGVVSRRRVPTPSGDYDATLDTVAELVSAVADGIETGHGIGIGIPGALSPASQLVKNANSTWLIGKPLGRDLERRLSRPVRIENDANCFALSEATDGAGAGAETVFGVILGTGVGAGIVHRGRLMTGANAIGGEWGHNPLPSPDLDELPGPECYCGRSGCIETFLSGPGLTADFRHSTGETAEPAGIARRAAEQDPAAEAALSRYENRLARALSSVINILDPDRIVLGGGMSNIERLYRNVPSLWPPHVFSDAIVTVLAPPVHGDSSGVRGAAWLWPEEQP